MNWGEYKKYVNEIDGVTDDTEVTNLADEFVRWYPVGEEMNMPHLVDVKETTDFNGARCFEDMFSVDECDSKVLEL